MPTTEELAWFEEKREGLDMLYHGKYVLIKDCTLIGVYDRQDEVFAEVGLRFSGQPCLVRFLGDEKDREGIWGAIPRDPPQGNGETPSTPHRSRSWGR